MEILSFSVLTQENVAIPYFDLGQGRVPCTRCESLAVFIPACREKVFRTNEMTDGMTDRPTEGQASDTLIFPM